LKIARTFSSLVILMRVKKYILESCFVDNQLFTYGGEIPQKFDEQFFGIDNFTLNKYRLGNLKLSHFLDQNNNCLDQATVEQLLGL
jgi:hypothetical protein